MPDLSMTTKMIIPCFGCGEELTAVMATGQVPVEYERLVSCLTNRVTVGGWMQHAANAYLCPTCQRDPEVRISIIGADLKGAIERALEATSTVGGVVKIALGNAVYNEVLGCAFGIDWRHKHKKVSRT